MSWTSANAVVYLLCDARTLFFSSWYFINFQLLYPFLPRLSIYSQPSQSHSSQLLTVYFYYGYLKCVLSALYRYNVYIKHVI